MNNSFTSAIEEVHVQLISATTDVVAKLGASRVARGGGGGGGGGVVARARRLSAAAVKVVEERSELRNSSFFALASTQALLLAHSLSEIVSQSVSLLIQGVSLEETALL